jgi:hypothetical protein
LDSISFSQPVDSDYSNSIDTNDIDKLFSGSSGTDDSVDDIDALFGNTKITSNDDIDALFGNTASNEEVDIDALFGQNKISEEISPDDIDALFKK